ncbi:MAG: response regulator transcription factor, partial [Desulfobacterales bacterium]|nr:response regulator transcription factor [Desulfobacterales bacterium]
KIIIFSMHTSSEYIFRAFQAGAKGYIIKSSVGKEIVEAVKTVYSNRHYLSNEIQGTIVEDYIEQRKFELSQNLIEKLSVREREVLQLVVEGKTSLQISKIINISAKTVDTYRHRMMRKLNVSDLTGLIKIAISSGIIHIE